jgi:SNF2 family DNA or RNA helicase
VEVWTARGLKRLLVLFFIDLSTRKVEIAGIASSANGLWMSQIGRNVTQTWHSQTAGIPSLLGVRIEPMGHQLYAMRRVLADSRPRFILADEVGLGKTIEAGLVLQALMQEEPQLRVLIIAPGSMSPQWFSEMYVRFGARAFGLTKGKCCKVCKRAHERP